MTAKNDITGDLIKSKNSSQAYSDGWDAIFGKKKSEEALAKMVEENEKMGLYDLDYDGFWIDPPSGWRYGFPMQFSVKEHKTFKDCLIVNGYPLKDIEFALNHMRMWK